MTTEAIIYARFSKADQVKGHSIDRQLENARAVCSANGYLTAPALTYIEKGRSAFSGANRAKGSLLANLELEISAGAHRGRVLVVEHLDRISRQGYDEVISFLKSCSNGGVGVATYDGSRVYPAGVHIEMISVIEVILKSELAREESEKKSGRIRKSFAAKRADAATTGAKRIASRPPSWIRRLPAGAGYELIEEHALVVREAHRLCQLGHGTATIAKIFNERGVPTWRAASQGWHESYVGRMLTMRTAIGEYVSTNHGTRILDYYPAVITVEEYNRTQAARERRAIPKNRGRRGKAQTNLFQGMARCSHCGGQMGMKPSRYVGYVEKRKLATGNAGKTTVQTAASYFKCVNNQRRIMDANGKRLCVNGKGIRYERLEPSILNKIMTLALDNDRYNVAEVSETRLKFAEADRQLSHAQEEFETLKGNLKIKVSATLIAMVDEAAEALQTLKANRDALSKALTREAGSQPSAAFLERIKATRSDMTDPDDETRRDARTMVHDSLKQVISDLVCDNEGNSVVTIANGLAAFRVNAAGEVDWQYDASGDRKAMKALSTGAFETNVGAVKALTARARRIAKAKAS